MGTVDGFRLPDLPNKLKQGSFERNNSFPSCLPRKPEACCSGRLSRLLSWRAHPSPWRNSEVTNARKGIKNNPPGRRKGNINLPCFNCRWDSHFRICLNQLSSNWHPSDEWGHKSCYSEARCSLRMANLTNLPAPPCCKHTFGVVSFKKQGTTHHSRLEQYL